MSTVNYAQLWQLALPQVIVVVAALIALAVDLLLLRARATQTRFTVAAILGSLGCILAIGRIVLSPAQANVLDGTLLANPLTHLVQIALLVLAIVTLLMATNSGFTEHVGEFVLLVLVATVGSMFLVSSQDLLVIFISLELLSLSLYILTAFDKHRPHSSEAALKYFLFGGMSAAFLLFGFSLLYGLSNSTSLPRIADTIHASAAAGSPLNPLLLIAIVTTVIGFGFKVAAFPFHFWAPDVYQGAPAPSAAFIASSSKVASFFIFFQVLAVGFAGAEGSAAWLHFTTRLGPCACRCCRALHGAGKSSRHRPEQRSTPAGLLRHCPRRLHAARHCGPHAAKSRRTALLRLHLCAGYSGSVRRCLDRRTANRRRSPGAL